MKIAFDGQPLLNQNKTGIAYYEDGLLKYLLKEYSRDEYGIDIFTQGHRLEKQKFVSDYSEKLKIFLQNGGFLALGIVPTIDLEALSSLNINILYKKFEEAINILSKDIDKNLIIEQCFITPGCGCGSLSIDLAKKASILTKELSQTLKKEIRINI